MTTYLNAPEVKIQIADEEVIYNNLVLEQSVAKHLGLPTAPAGKASEPAAKSPKK